MKALINKYLVSLLIASFLVPACTTSPTGEVVKELKEILKVVKNYEYGDSRSWLQHYHDVMAKVHNDAEAKEEAEKLLLGVLNSGSSHAAKSLLCKSLGEIGSKASLPVLEKLLFDPESSHLALIALTPIPLDKVDDLLLGAISKVESPTQIEIMNALALRKSSVAIEGIKTFMNDDDPAIAETAIRAIGQIGGMTAVELLFDRFQNSVDYKWALAEALFTALENEQFPNETSVYESIYYAQPPLSVKTAAFSGLLTHTPENEQVDFLLQTLLVSDTRFRESLLPLVRKLPPSAPTQIIIDRMSDFPSAFQQNLMLALADKKDTAIRPLVLQMLGRGDENGKIAALKALKSVSNTSDILVLAKVAAASSGQPQQLARECIYWMEGENTNQKILEEAAKSNDIIRPELIMAMGYRKISQATGFVLSQITNKNQAIRLAAIEAAGKIGTLDDLDSVISRALTGIKQSDVDIVTEALTRISLNSDQPDACVESINDNLKSASDVTSIVALISTLGNIGTDLAFEYIRPYLGDGDYEVHFACLKAFSSWHNDAPMDDLEQYLSNSKNLKNRQQALVGIVTLVQNTDQLTGVQKSQKLTETYKNASTTAEKVIVINGISRISTMESLDFVTGKLEEEDIKNAAREAFIRIADNLRYNMDSQVVGKIDTVIAATSDQDFKEKLIILKRSLEL